MLTFNQRVIICVLMLSRFGLAGYLNVTNVTDSVANQALVQLVSNKTLTVTEQQQLMSSGLRALLQYISPKIKAMPGYTGQFLANCSIFMNTHIEQVDCDVTPVSTAMVPSGYLLNPSVRLPVEYALQITRSDIVLVNIYGDWTRKTMAYSEQYTLGKFGRMGTCTDTASMTDSVGTPTAMASLSDSLKPSKTSRVSSTKSLSMSQSTSLSDSKTESRTLPSTLSILASTSSSLTVSSSFSESSTRSNSLSPSSIGSGTESMSLLASLTDSSSLSQTVSLSQSFSQSVSGSSSSSQSEYYSATGSRSSAKTNSETYAETVTPDLPTPAPTPVPPTPVPAGTTCSTVAATGVSPSPGNLSPQNVAALTWQCTLNSGTYTRSQGASYCSSLGGSWRLPTIWELFTLYNQKSILGGNYQSSYYWSSTPVAGLPTYAWHVYFDNGLVASTMLPSLTTFGVYTSAASDGSTSRLFDLLTILTSINHNDRIKPLRTTSDLQGRDGFNGQDGYNRTWFLSVS